MIRDDASGSDAGMVSVGLRSCESDESFHKDVRAEELNNHKIVSSVPASVRTKIQIACALICDPPVLVLDKPLQFLAIDDATRVMECLREYVDNSGLERSEDHRHGRRPRTCIFTSSSAMFLAVADAVLTIGEDGAVKPTLETEKLVGETEKLIHDKEEGILRAKQQHISGWFESPLSGRRTISMRLPRSPQTPNDRSLPEECQSI